MNQNNNLPGQQLKELVDALMDAFPTKASLERLLSFELSKNLDAIAGGNNLTDIVFNLITTAESQGWLTELVAAAKKSNPGNALLSKIFLDLSVNITAIKYIPHTGAKHFVGRNEELAKIHDKLQFSNSVAISAVAGMGGVGKTELALKYAKKFLVKYPAPVRVTNLQAP